MREISEKEAAELGIDLTMIKVCRRFRHLAKLDRLRIDMTEHRSGLNKHLFGYIEYCGMTSLDLYGSINKENGNVSLNVLCNEG